MKLTEFYALCEREWNKPRRGEVSSIRLTEAGRRELVNDVLVDPVYDSCLVLVNQVVNPITRTVVKIRTTNSRVRETARVAVMGGTYRQTWWPVST